MPRPHKCRTIYGEPIAQAFKPAGMPGRALETVELRLDEVETLRLADLEGLYQEQAAQHMGISRQTFGRLLEQAHRKVADALLHGKMLVFTGGNVSRVGPRLFVCRNCGHRFEVPFGQDRPTQCPACAGADVKRIFEPPPVPQAGTCLPPGGRGRRGRGFCGGRGPRA